MDEIELLKLEFLQYLKTKINLTFDQITKEFATLKDAIQNFLEDNGNRSMPYSNNSEHVLTEKQQEILNVLKREGSLYHNDLREKVKIPSPAINTYFEILEDLKLIEIVHKKESDGRFKKYIALKNHT